MQVKSVRKSKEVDVDKFIDSVIVIMVNETESLHSEWGKQKHSVWRYWQDPITNWIAFEYLYTDIDKEFFYEQVEVFDNWSIGYIDNTFTLMFFKDYLGELLPLNYEFKAYQQYDADIVAHSFYDSSGEGEKGDWSLIILVKYAGAIQILPVEMNINVDAMTWNFV